MSQEITFAYTDSGEVIAAGVVLPFVGLACLGLRFAARAGKKNKIGIDDWLVVPSWLFVTGMGICLVIGAAKKIMGYPTPPAPSSDPASQETQYLPGQELLEKLEYAFFIFMIAAYGMIKLSVIYFYRRIFVAGGSRFNVVTNVATAIVILWTIGFLLVQIFSCRSHFDYNWGPLADQAHCVGGLPFLEGLMISDFITDFLVLFLPFPLIWRLHMSAKRKIAVTGILLLGTASLAASAARLVLQIQEAKGGYTTKTDVYLTITTILYWSLIEAGIAVIAISLPAIRALFAQKSIQSIVASVRSVISLESLRSQGSANSSKATRATRNEYTELYGANGSTVDTVIAESKNHPPMPQLPDAIHVQKDVTQRGGPV